MIILIFLRNLDNTIEAFGGREYIVTGIPAQLPDIATTDLLMEIIDDFVNGKTNLSKDVLLERVATMSCKARSREIMNCLSSRLMSF